MGCNYIYIDDTTSLQAEGTIKGLQKKGILSIKHELPIGEWDQQIEFILEGLGNADGLILDQRLDQGASASGNPSKYRGTSLAQEIRVLTKEGKLKDIPIILLSAEANITGSFDNTGIDLFDKVISKERIPHVFPIVRNQLVALVEGYEILNTLDRGQKSKSCADILAIGGDELSQIDPRFISKLESMLMSPSHLISNFIIKEVLEKSGFLIDEKLLAARLGIDLHKSPDWPAVVDGLKSALYKGVFCTGWNRWWMSSIEDNLKSMGLGDDLRTMAGPDRVEFLRNVLGINNLVASTPLKYAKSVMFWNIDRGTEAPIDVTDGLLIQNQDDLYPWQDRQYVSFLAALQRINSDQWRDVSALEKPKLEKLQIIFKRERTRR
jgi:hypothetical protein